MDKINEGDAITDLTGTDLTNTELDFILNSAEMNLPRPEDLDEPGECSTAAVS
jgi:hypothetical protein